MKLQGLQFAQHSGPRLIELFEGGEISRAEVLHEIRLTPAYFELPASAEWIGMRYRQQLAAAAKTAEEVNQAAFYLKDLITDLMIEQITPAEFDYCLTEWRKSGNEFLPKLSGPFLKILHEAGYARPSKGQGKRHIERLRALVDPDFKPEPKRSFTGARTEPKPHASSETTPEQRKAFVASLDAIKPKLKAMPRTKTDRKQLEESRIRSLCGLAHEVFIREVKQGGSSFFAALALIDKNNPKSVSPLKQFMSRDEALAWVSEIRTGVKQ